VFGSTTPVASIKSLMSLAFVGIFSSLSRVCFMSCTPIRPLSFLSNILNRSRASESNAPKRNSRTTIFKTYSHDTLLAFSI